MLLHCDSFATSTMTGTYATSLPKWDDQPTSYYGSVRIGDTVGRDGKGALLGGLMIDPSYRYWTPVGKTFEPQGLSTALFTSASYFVNSAGDTTVVPLMVLTTTPYNDRLTDVSGRTGLLISYRPSTRAILIERISTGSRSTLATSANNVLPEGDWSRIEARVDITGNAVAVRVNGVEVVASTSSLSTLAAGIRYVAFSVAAASVDDALIYTSETGDAFNTYLGDVVIDCLLPNAGGAFSNFTPSSGSSANFTYVDESSINTSDYVQTTTAGAKDSYGFSDMTNLTATVIGVVVSTHLAAVGGTTRPFGAGLAIEGGTEVAGTAKRVPMTSTQALSQTVFATAPSGGAWTPAKVNAAEFGFKVTAN